MFLDRQRRTGQRQRYSFFFDGNISNRRFRGIFLVVFKFVRRGVDLQSTRRDRLCTEDGTSWYQSLQILQACREVGRNRGCCQLGSRHTGNPFTCQLDDERAAVNAGTKKLDAWRFAAAQRGHVFTDLGRKLVDALRAAHEHHGRAADTDV